MSRDKGERENIFFNTSGSLSVESCFLCSYSEGVLSWSMHLKILSRKLKFGFSVSCAIFLCKNKKISSPAKHIMEMGLSNTDVSLTVSRALRSFSKAGDQSRERTEVSEVSLGKHNSPK